MNRDECYNEEWWNFGTSFALWVPAWLAFKNNFSQSAVVVCVTGAASALRHVPRQYLGPVGLDLFRGFDFTMIGILLVVVYRELAGEDHKLDWSTHRRCYAVVIVLYAALTNALFFAANVDFPWNIAVYYYVLPVVYILCLRCRHEVTLPAFSRTHKVLLGFLVVVAVLVRMTEQPGLMDKIGFDDGGTTCILDHGIWHIVAAAILCVLLMKPDRCKVEPAAQSDPERSVTSAKPQKPTRSDSLLRL